MQKYASHVFQVILVVRYTVASSGTWKSENENIVW